MTDELVTSLEIAPEGWLNYTCLFKLTRAYLLQCSDVVQERCLCDDSAPHVDAQRFLATNRAGGLFRSSLARRDDITCEEDLALWNWEIHTPSLERDPTLHALARVRKFLRYMRFRESYPPVVIEFDALLTHTAQRMTTLALVQSSVLADANTSLTAVLRRAVHEVLVEYERDDALARALRRRGISLQTCTNWIVSCDAESDQYYIDDDRNVRRALVELL